MRQRRHSRGAARTQPTAPRWKRQEAKPASARRFRFTALVRSSSLTPAVPAAEIAPDARAPGSQRQQRESTLLQGLCRLPTSTPVLPPAGGAANIPTFIALLGGQLNVVALLDGGTDRERSTIQLLAAVWAGLRLRRRRSGSEKSSPRPPRPRPSLFGSTRATGRAPARRDSDLRADADGRDPSVTDQ